LVHGQYRRLRSVTAVALFVLAGQARALGLGEPVVASAPGQPLDVRFAVSLARGESIQPSCFQLASGPGPAPGLAAGTVSLERSASGAMLRVRSPSPIEGEALSVSIVAKCEGQAAEYRRDYTIALGARKAAASNGAPAPAASPAAPALAMPPLPSIATLIARIGDTLESIARAIFPSNRAARASYIDALRAGNPPLASLRDDEPIPVDSPIALPDLRAFSQAQREHPHARRASAAPAPATPAARPRPAHQAMPPPRAESAPRPEKPERPRAEAAVPRVRESIAPPRESPERPVRGDFVLKLSSPLMDLTRSRGIDERSRAQLRERLTILDADDQVSALLALRNSVKQLETQVAQLQLKLSGMPSSFPSVPAAPASPAPAPATTKAPEPAVVAAPPATSPAVEANPAPPATPPAVEANPAPPVAPPAVEAKPAPPVAPPVVETKPAPAPPAAKETARPRLPVEGPTPWMDYGLWALAIVLLALAVMLAVRLARRARAARAEDEDVATAQPMADAAALDDDSIVIADEPVRVPEPAPVASRREIDSDVVLPTRIPSNTEDLRQRYIEERFPEIGKGVIVLDDPDSVVKGARLFYEDGALARAVELLQYAIERRPEEIKTWLALFEIFRLERLTGEFAQLATRFREQHGKSEYWPKVQYFGREIDPGNALYAAAPINNFETIGPAQARRIAAADAVDPVAENWLGAPMDFQNEVLANELRKTLMSDSGINEEDLVPNPMPALRNVEMFSVA
jgi:hypothetical protein